MKKLFTFFSTFLKDPKNVGAIVPLSKRVAKELTKYFTLRSQTKSYRILEVGAGIGNISETIVQSLGPKDEFDIVEIDPKSCKILKELFKKDPRVTIHCLSIMDWKPRKNYDFIISTLPFNSFTAKFVKEIFQHYENLLRKKGVLSYVEYVGLQKIISAFANGKHQTDIKKRIHFLKKIKQQHLMEKKTVLLNFLPCHVYHLNLNTHIR